MTSSIDFVPGTKDFRDRLTQHATKKYRGRSLSAIKKIAIHHSLTKSGSAESFARYHVKENGWPGIGYHFVIEKNGDVKWCNNLEIKSYHVGNSNKFAVGICLVGDYREQLLSDAQLTPLLKLLKFLIRELDLSYRDVLGHNEFNGYEWRSCPCINMEALRDSIVAKQAVVSSTNTDVCELEHVFSHKSSLNPNDFVTKPGESVFAAFNRLGLYNLGDIFPLNKTIDYKEKKQEPQVINVKGSMEVLPDKVGVIIKAMKKLKYKVFETDDKPYNLNIVGVRNENATPNSFDDEINVFWKFKNKWNHKSYTATTDPGLHYLQNPMRLEGTAILKEGQYRGAYKFGLHRQKYTALVQAKPVTVIRDFDRDSELDFNSGKEQTGFFSIHIHHASYSGKSTIVDKWSAGCQVIANIKDYNEFIKFCKLGASEWGGTFTYTLINQRDLA